MFRIKMKDSQDVILDVLVSFMQMTEVEAKTLISNHKKFFRRL